MSRYNDFVSQAGLAMLMSRMYHEAPKEYKFFPETWVLPAEMNEFRCERAATPAFACCWKVIAAGVVVVVVADVDVDDSFIRAAVHGGADVGVIGLGGDYA